MKATSFLQAGKLACLIYKAADDKKAEDIVVLDMRKASDLCDYFFICSASNTRQAKAISDGIDEELTKRDIRPRRIEGYDEGKWIVLDCGSVIVHIFYDQVRALYKLERLWGDLPRVDCSGTKPKASPTAKKKKAKRGKPASSKKKKKSSR